MRDPVTIGLRCQDAGARALTLHPRTRTQMYSGSARWEEIAAVKAAHLVSKRAVTVKVIASGTLDKPVTVSGLKVTPGARKIIEAAGGKVLE